VSEQKKRDGRGGARQGSGPHRRRLFFDAETAKLLAEHMRQLNEPGLSEEEAVKRLLLSAQISRETAYTEALQIVQDVLRQRWQAILGPLLSNVGLQLENLSSQIIDQLTEEVQKKEPR